MEANLHQVTSSELPQLRDWLKQHLPDSYKLYTTVCETIRGRWEATTYVTLGWPDIRAAAEGPVNSQPECAPYFAELRVTSVFSPDDDDLMQLLLHPEFLDWTKPIAFQCISSKSRAVIEHVAASKGGKCMTANNFMLEANAEDLPAREVPHEFELRSLDPELHTDYAISTWPHARKHADKYVKDLLRSFPSVGLFDKTSGDCIGLEIGTEYGTMGMLHVRENFRGRGLGKIITSHMAQFSFQDGLPAHALVVKSNEVSLRMHLNMGFRIKCDIDWTFYIRDDLQSFLDLIGYKGDMPVS